MTSMETYQRADPLIGTALEGRYRVDAVIATGGMSTVYRGLDTRLDRPVALKVMDSRYSGDVQFLTRFQREAKAVARLKGDGLVAVYDQGGGSPGDEPPFLVMELVDGGTLRELLRERGPMPPHAVAAVLTPICRGLAVAHAAGLVHRDVKPENVLISDDGEVKIADFGLVRAVAEAGITSTSVILGTAAYLSPEQVGSGDSDPRSDVYAVGILAYELLTGRTPFTGDTALSVAYQRMDNDVPPPSSAIAGVPAQFDALIGRATDRDPAARFADAAELGAALAEVIDELGLPAFRVPAPTQSAQHRAATAFHSRVLQDPATAAVRPPDPRRDTRVFTPAELPLPPEPLQDEPEYQPISGQFAGIELEQFHWARQRSKRVLAAWVVIVLILAGLLAMGAWTLGNNLPNLI
ncbi:serine/threonine protein kinase [Mycobacterium sp. Root265]|uniref:protein kinase domain-containing protein n=1 Tax=Mycobacterium sp. Root265 TaxID=1736504 RepID=UPI00070A7E00|nr:protein kinase [Mycobacterium sp. Root265]KRD17184.1 serine/threonine protein kinase [Mycobacterium sp. Root265]